jgi:non-specific serine/threonine protein kinase/serine/threonine-protein kinase
MQRYQQLKELFQSALEQTPAERAAFLAQACPNDAELRREVESLLAHHDEAEGFLEAVPAPLQASLLAADKATLLSPGRRLGPYEILREIGRGGMGVVYLAARADEQFVKQVAIKLIHTPERHLFLQRFRQERQILAQLNHPNIAQMLDAGTTEEGWSYFVMEYIEGLPIDKYCAEHNLALAERLQLFRQVCAAVSYAHQNLVVHRDLKPSNILITPSVDGKAGTPKLLDFGIAKLLPPTGVEDGQPTATGMHLLTPDYASPEHINHRPITTASDIYSLGVLLYELLSGQRPYRVMRLPPHEMARVISEQEPARPSAAALQTPKETRGTMNTKPLDEGTARGPGERTHRSSFIVPPAALRGDLDNIVLMALRKEPERRYASVEQFAEDVRRYLEGLPVLARTPTLGYRASKFIRRHKVGVTTTALIALSLVAGVITTVWQARVARLERARAEQRFNDVRKLANSFLFEFHDGIEKLPGATPMRELVVKRALEYLDSLAREASNDAELQSELATAYERVGNIQGNPNSANLGDPAGALLSYQKALTLREALADAASQQTQLDLARSHDRVATMLRFEHRTAEALEHLKQALALRETIVKTESAPRQARRDLAATYEVLGATLADSGDRAGGLVKLRELLRLREALAAEPAANAEDRRLLALAHLLLLIQLGQREDGLTHAQQAIALYQALLATDARNTQLRRELAQCFDNRGTALWNANDLPGALKNYRTGLQLREALVNDDPVNVQFRRDLAISLGNVGYTLVQTGKGESGLTQYRRSLDIFESLLVAAPANPNAQRDVAVSYNYFGDVYKLLATQPATSLLQRRAYWQQARSWYEQSRHRFLEMRTRGTARGTDDSRLIDGLAQEIRACEAALAKLK